MPARLHPLKLACGLLVSTLLAVQPVAAQSMLRDAETENFLNKITEPLSVSAGLGRTAVKVVLVNDGSINAFVAGGQMIYMHTGTIEASDSANELEGVLAHEMGHIEAGDVARGTQAASSATRVTLLSLLLGAAAMAAGAGEAGMAAMMAGQQAAMGKYLAFSRQQEGSADASAVRHLNAAQLSGKGMVSFFQKMKREEYRLTPSYTKIDPFMVDHPMTDERERVLLADLSKSPYWDKKEDPAKQAEFARIKAKLIGYLDDPPIVMNKYPVTDRSVPARYARAYAWHRGGYPEKAAEEIDSLVAQFPHDPYFLELKGQILLEGGKPAQAIPFLREAVARSGSNPLIASLLGNALVATEKPDDFKEAAQVLKVSVQRDNDNPQAWYNLGLVYTRLGDEPRAKLAMAERFGLEGNPRMAQLNAEMALRGLPVGTPDYIRAQDLAMTAKDDADRQQKRRGR